MTICVLFFTQRPQRSRGRREEKIITHPRIVPLGAGIAIIIICVLFFTQRPQRFLRNDGCKCVTKVRHHACARTSPNLIPPCGTNLKPQTSNIKPQTIIIICVLFFTQRSQRFLLIPAQVKVHFDVDAESTGNGVYVNDFCRWKINK
jgi:hypothetical protein